MSKLGELDDRCDLERFNARRRIGDLSDGRARHAHPKPERSDERLDLSDVAYDHAATLDRRWCDRRSRRRRAIEHHRRFDWPRGFAPTSSDTARTSISTYASFAPKAEALIHGYLRHLLSSTHDFQAEIRSTSARWRHGKLLTVSQICRLRDSPATACRSSGGLRRCWTGRRRCGPSAAPPSPNSTPSPNPSSSTSSATPRRNPRGWPEHMIAVGERC